MIRGVEQAEAPPQQRRTVVSSYVVFLGVFALLLFLTHLAFLRLPYFWDEAAQFIPSALDVYHSGSLIATSVKPNIHPPGVMVYLAAFWRVLGFSPVVTRSAMLILSSFGLLAAFLLSIELSKDVRGMPAFLAVALLYASPLFFAQSMLAQLDAPAMVFTTLALLWFLQDRLVLSVIACVALVMTKETGVVVPLVFAAILARERQWREAAYFLGPVVVLAAWIAALASVTGSWAGNAGFASYNVRYPLHPARIGMAILRRAYFLCVADFRWIGTLAVVVVCRHGQLRSRPWRTAFLVLAAQTAMLCVVGGAVLERYLLPVMPIVFAAMAAALSLFKVKQRVAASLVLLAASAAGNLINPPYPFPLENNLAFTDFLRLQSDAADYLTHWYPNATVSTAWPLSLELRHPELGFVPRRMTVQPLANFTPGTLAATRWKRSEIVVVYSRSWDPPNSLMRLEPIQHWWRHFGGYVADADMQEARARIPFELEQHFERRGQWLDIYAGPDAPRRNAMPEQTARLREPDGFPRGTGIRAGESSCAPRQTAPGTGPEANAGPPETPRCVPPKEHAKADMDPPVPGWRLRGSRQ